MADFAQTMADHLHLSEEEQKKAAQSSGTDMDEAHKNYLATVMGMLERKEIRLLDPESLLNSAQYASLGELDRNKADAALVNIVDLLNRIELLYRDKATPDASPELAGMIEHLWQMKSRVEDRYGDVYKI